MHKDYRGHCSYCFFFISSLSEIIFPCLFSCKRQRLYLQLVAHRVTNSQRVFFFYLNIKTMKNTYFCRNIGGGESAQMLRRAWDQLRRNHMHTVGTGCIIWAALRPAFVLCLLTTCHPSCRNSVLHCGLQSVIPPLPLPFFSPLVLCAAARPAAQPPSGLTSIFLLVQPLQLIIYRCTSRCSRGTLF